MLKTIRAIALVTFVAVALVGCTDTLEKTVDSTETLEFTTALEALEKTVNGIVQSSPEDDAVDSEMVIREGESMLGSRGYVFSPISLNKVDVRYGDCYAVLTPAAKTTAEFTGVINCTGMVDSSAGVDESDTSYIAILTLLASDESAGVRGSVGANPSTPVDLLRKLASDGNEEVRGSVAENPSTPVDLLRKLASDANTYVRGGVARNPSTPVDLLDKLASDASEFVREVVAENPSTPVDSLNRLASDENEAVRSSVASRNG